MPALNQNVLCRYHYDALDRVIGTASDRDAVLQYFYCKSRLATEIQGAAQRSIFQQGEQLLAQQNQQVDLHETSLLVTDQMRSVLRTVNATRPHPFSYPPYGSRPTEGGLSSVLAFNGERLEPITGDYLLGNGYRAFNPVLLRFNSPDSLSPFGKGGFNAYAYCLGDPVNRLDKSGHAGLKYIRYLFNGNQFDEIPVTYKNLQPEKFKLERLNFEKQQAKTNEVLIKKVSTSEDLQFVGDGTAKFIFTEDNRLIVGRELDPYKYGLLDRNIDYLKPDRRQEFGDAHHYMTHALLADFARTSKVISAGKINPLTGTISNSSGHYKPKFESLFDVVHYFIKNRIMVIRNTGNFDKGN
jgi:RHS repeat-associated protein